MKFDWVAPQDTIAVALLLTASARRNSSLRPLFPPPAKPVRSSRLIQISEPSFWLRLGRMWQGVGRMHKGIRGSIVGQFSF